MSLIAKVVQKAASEPGLHYLNPPVPHACNLPGGLSIGSKVYIQGTCNPDCSRFSVNFQRGTGDEADIYLHLDARLDTGEVVRNTRSSDAWGSEETDGGLPFAAGKAFLLVIGAFADNYEIEVNGKAFATLAHRDGLPVSNVTHLAIHGGVLLQALHLPIDTMPRNLRLSIPGKTKVGDQFSIKGVVNEGADRVVMNWQCGPSQSDDVIFHLNPRFQGDNLVIRNSRCDEHWAGEEREGPSPFNEGVPFHIQVSVASDAFRVRVDGKDCFNFTHRLDMRNASVMLIEGDVQITDFQVNSPLGKLITEGNSRDFQNASLQVFYPATPSAHQIPGGLASGKIVVVSGKVDTEASRMFVNLQCGPGDDADVALHLNPRFEDSNYFVVLNSKDGDWQDEVRVEDGPFAPGHPFELVALLDGDGISLAINGSPFARFPVRLDLTRADHVAVGGTVTVQRILVL